MSSYKQIKHKICMYQARIQGGGGGKGALPPKGPQGERGNMLFIKVIKSRKWKNNARNIILFKSTLFSHIFKNVPFKMYT